MHEEDGLRLQSDGWPAADGGGGRAGGSVPAPSRNFLVHKMLSTRACASACLQKAAQIRFRGFGLAGDGTALHWGTLLCSTAPGLFLLARTFPSRAVRAEAGWVSVPCARLRPGKSNAILQPARAVKSYLTVGSLLQLRVALYHRAGAE